MSKYYKAEDVERLIENICNVMIGKEEPIETALCELPTIEVSEDCISREYILGEAFASDEYNRETKSFDLPVVSVRDIEDAPSVVLTVRKNRTVEQSSMVGEWIAKDGVFYCSRCDNDSGLSEEDVDLYEMSLPNYCQDCGAKMKG